MSTTSTRVRPALPVPPRASARVVWIWRHRLRVLGLLAAVPFVIDAVVHGSSASAYDPAQGGLLTEGNLFRAEAGVAALVALLLVLRPRRAVWLAALATAVTALGAVLLYRYVNVGSIGPIPNLYEPTWQVPGKLLSAYAEAFAALLSAFVAVMLSRSAKGSRCTAIGAGRQPPYSDANR